MLLFAPMQPESDWKPLAKGAARARKRAASDAAESLEPPGRNYGAADYGRVYGGDAGSRGAGRGGGTYSIGDYTAAAAAASRGVRRTVSSTGDSRYQDDSDVHSSITSLRESNGSDDWRDGPGAAFGSGADGGYSGSRGPAAPSPMVDHAHRAEGMESPVSAKRRQPDFGAEHVARHPHEDSISGVPLPPPPTPPSKHTTKPCAQGVTRARMHA